MKILNGLQSRKVQIFKGKILQDIQGSRELIVLQTSANERVRYGVGEIASELLMALLCEKLTEWL